MMVDQFNIEVKVNLDYKKILLHVIDAYGVETDELIDYIKNHLFDFLNTEVIS
jgi:hypothetical protein